MYVNERSVDKMVIVLKDWVQNNPGDQNVRTALEELERQLNAMDSSGADTL